MCERFIKFIPSEEAFWLMENKPNAFRLLTHIANTARRTPGHPDGLLIGQCHLQSWKAYKLTEQQYRTAKKILVMRKHITIFLTNRTLKKSTTGSTTNSTIVQLCSSTIWDINPSVINDSINDRATTDQRPINDKQEVKKVKKEKEVRNTPTPFFSISKIKCFFRELVSLTKEQHASLLSQHGEDFLNRMLDTLDSYKGTSGKEYESDFHAMKAGGWVVERVKKESVSQGKTNEKHARDTPELKVAKKYKLNVLGGENAQ
jgi:hypothetical protein